MKRVVSRVQYGVALLILIAFVSLSVAAQLPTATILGTVKDSTGGAVAGATVTVTNTDTGFNRSGPTMDDGSYRFPALPVGEYEVKVMKEGFQTLDRTGITLNVGAIVNLELALQVGATSQTVVVTGEAPLVDTTSSSVGNLVNDAQVTDLPLNGRNWTDLTLMQPGITQINAIQSFSGATGVNNVGTAGFNGTLYSTNGGTDRSNTFLLDGADERTMMGFGNASVTGTSLGVDGIKEYKVVSVLASAEYGLTAGSQTTIVSKGGTNQWHGDAFEYLRNASLDAEPYNSALDTSNSNGCGTTKLFAFPCKRVAPFQKNNFGGAFGGPIQKNKTFFYAVFEGIQQRLGTENTKSTLPAACFVDPTTGLPVATTAPGSGAVAPGTKGVIPATIKNDGCVPGSFANPIAVPSTIQTLANYFPMPNVPLTTATVGFNYAIPYTQPTSEQYGQIRLDRTISGADSMFFRYTQDDASTLPINGGSGDPRSLNNDHSAEHFGTLSETHIFSPTVLNTARLSYSRNLQHLIPETAPSTYPGLPTEPVSIAADTLFITDSGNVYGQPGAANPGAIPQIFIPNPTGPPCTLPGATTNSACYSQYGGASGLSNNVGPGVTDSNVYTLSDDVYWTKGKHAFKFGILANRYDWDSLVVFGATGSVTFPGAASTTGGCLNPANQCPLAAYFEGVYSSISRAIPNSKFARDFRFYSYGFYGQDDYKIMPRLTLNLGLRYEFATVPHETLPGSNFSLRFPATDTNGTLGPLFRNPSLHNFSPRIGFAWDVFGNGKTSLHGGAGLYYDVGTYGGLEQSNAVSTPPLSGTVTFTNPDLVGVNCCTATTAYRPGVGGAPGPAVGQSAVQAFSVPLGSGTNFAVSSPRTVDYNLDQPTLLQRALGIDQQLPAQMVLSISYVGARSWHLYQEREGDPIGFYAAMDAPTGTSACSGATILGCVGVPIGTGVAPAGPGGATTYTAGGYTINKGVACTASTPCNTQPVACPGPGCTPVVNPFSGLPYYCSPADGTTGPPSAAHPCFSNASVIPCTTPLTASNGVPSCPGRVNSTWNGVSNVTTSGDNYFNSLQVVLTKRTTHGLQFQVSYTWQKLLDTGTGESTSESTGTNAHEFPVAGGGQNGTLDRGPSSYNATDALKGSVIYRAGNLVKPETLLGKFVDGWGFSAIPTYQTGYPLSITGAGRSLDSATFATDRLNICPNYNPSTFKNGVNTGDRSKSTYFDLSMICLQPAGTLGNSAKAFFTGPGIFNLNTSFTKDTKVRFLGEAGNVQFRFEMFNTLNHPIFTAPTTSVFTVSPASACPGGGSLATLVGANNTSICGVTESTSAGRLSLTTIEPMRQMQVSLRVVW